MQAAIQLLARAGGVALLQERSGASESICVDALRYYLARDIAFSSDAEFSIDMLVKRYNGDLANDLGNVLNRVLRAKYHTGAISGGVCSGLAALGVQYQLARVVAALCEAVYMYSAMRWLVFRSRA